VQVAALREDCAGILILFDADDDCPAELAPTLEEWAREAAGEIPCAVVMANREYEACFWRAWKHCVVGQALPQYQQTRGTLAMLAQWISIASQEMFRKARTEPLITLGSAPLGEPGFRSVVLGQLGEARLVAAIDVDIAGQQAHAKALDADTKVPSAIFTAV